MVNTSSSLSHHLYAARISALSKHLDEILAASPIAFSEMTMSKVPASPGVYIIYTSESGPLNPYYIGRSKKLSQRLYRNHLMGQLSNARLKKYLIDSKECLDIEDAKRFIRGCCYARWIIVPEFRARFLAEGFLTATLQPKYGLYEEH